MKESTVLVTGGAGFIGSHVVDKLVGLGHEVVVLDNLSTGLLENLRRHVDDGNVGFVEGDIREVRLVDRLFKRVDAVVHLAAVTSVPFSMSHPVLTNRVNLDGTLNLLRASLENNVERFVLVSSCAIYGEPCYSPVDEEHPMHPLSPYAASKLAAEHYCRVFKSAYGLDAVVLRPFNVYGDRQRREDMYSGVITRFAESMLTGKPLVVYGDGSQTRDFVHVYDVA
ncbi:MAG: SDR family NAD(P)-dependent oxidoreductase, partial [Candidatus Bathyarchaeota archaeon]